MPRIQTFSIKGSIATGWEVYTDHFWRFMIMTLVLILPSVLKELLGTTGLASEPLFWTPFLMGIYFLNIVFSLGFLKVCVEAIRGESFELSDVIVDGKSIWIYLASSLLVVVPFAAIAALAYFGLNALLIVGSLAVANAIISVAAGAIVALSIFIFLAVFSVVLAFLPFEAIDNPTNPIETLKRAYKRGVGIHWQILGFVLTVTVLNVLGIMAFFVGYLITLPWTLLAFAHAYEELSSRV